jgi:uncharacterized damage-inducible protein DinB
MPAKLFLIAICCLLAFPVFAQKTTVKEAFLEKWENSKNYLLNIAEMMPEEDYAYKPTERQLSFKEQLLHIKDNMDWLSTRYFASEGTNTKEKEIPNSKAETIALLNIAFDSVSEIIKKYSEENLTETVEFFAGPKSKLQILNLLQDHVTHHRGQLIVYLNLKNVEPPKYVGW